MRSCSAIDSEFFLHYFFAVTNPEQGPNLFTVEVIHDGCFCGFGANLEYVNDTIFSI